MVDHDPTDVNIWGEYFMPDGPIEMQMVAANVVLALSDPRIKLAGPLADAWEEVHRAMRGDAPDEISFPTVIF